MIKYRHALDSNNNCVDVKSLERKTLSKHIKFYTIDFKQELIPRLGKSNTKHFALKPNIIPLGSKETYLHALGKRTFYNTYLKCLKDAQPFFFKYKTKNFCNRLQNKFHKPCFNEIQEELFDLT